MDVMQYIAEEYGKILAEMKYKDIKKNVKKAAKKEKKK